MLDEMTRSATTEPSLSEKVTRASRASDSWAGTTTQLLPTDHIQSRLLSVTDTEYPNTLRAIAARPPHLHVIGRLNQPGDDRAIAIVGSRRATPRGCADARQIATDLAGQGHTIVSGLAAGIDTCAHRGALDAHGRTVAVIGTGVDRVYPATNRALRDEIAATGAIVSQFALGHPASKTTFPARNVLIAGLSAASLLVELNEHSGTRIEANITLEQNKPVLLWAPILGTASWARRFAQHDLVTFVDSVDDIAAALSPSDGP